MKTFEMLREENHLMGYIDPDEQKKVAWTASKMFNAFEGGAWKLAKEIMQEDTQDWHADMWAALWAFFPDSRQRAFLKGEDRKYLEEK